MNVLRYFFNYSVFGLLIYLGLYEKIDFFKPFPLVIAWVVIYLSFWTFSDKFMWSIRKFVIGRNVIPQWLDCLIDCLIAIAFYNAGFKITALFYTFHFVVSLFAEKRLKEKINYEYIQDQNNR